MSPGASAGTADEADESAADREVGAEDRVAPEPSVLSVVEVLRYGVSIVGVDGEGVPHHRLSGLEVVPREGDPPRPAGPGTDVGDRPGAPVPTQHDVEVVVVEA